MPIDVNALSAKELDALIDQAKRRKTTLKKRKPIATVRNKILSLATAEGYSISELFGAGPARSAGAPRKAATKKTASKGRKLGKVPPKYRNPGKPTETWSGRGKQPLWLAALVKKGKKVEEFLIKKV